MGKCSICQESGHNKTTCSRRLQKTTPLQKITLNGLNDTPKTANFSTNFPNSAKTQVSATTYKPEIMPTPLKPPLTPKDERDNNNNNKSRNQLTEKVMPTPVIYNNAIYPAQAKKILDRIEAGKQRQGATNSKEVDLIKKLEKIPIPEHRAVVETTSNFCTGCHNQGHMKDKCPSPMTRMRNDRYDKKCGHCDQYNHNIKTCQKLLKQKLHNDEEGEEKCSGPGSWLNCPARIRLRKPLTPTDGPGYIYMYTYLKPKSEEDKELFKIGMSKNEEGKRRIEVQEARNKDQYRVVYHEETPYRYLTENVIHLQLKEMREPREEGDGRTEWFRGSQDSFLRVIKDVIKEVRFAIRNDYFANIPIADAAG
ncbi:uncharacterized protein LOC110852596 [Folsomia candida]|uniref:CCHC-type domain-containing protein n=1 Tax=Folsomia candida TaxID=158441 RepID=A0A226E5K2_FOLCA|nr:uncharacterized protein LOC110852596 [Folsomia candida]OXA52354.1 hypothetical protein Fcan01_13046 [Folsomia candida]